MPSPILWELEFRGKKRVSSNQGLTLGGTTVAPGTRARIDLPVADLYTATSLYMPVEVICGRHPGPTLFISAAVHGDELNGVEIVRRLLKRKALKSLRGNLLAVPIVNVHGFLDQSRYLPDRRDLNRSFPGSARGSIAARLAHLFTENILSQARYGIDLHTGAIHRGNLAQIRANLDDPETLELAKAFAVPVIVNASLRPGSLRETAHKRGIKILVYEVGEALRFDEVGIGAGVRGIMNVMRLVGMLPRSSTARRRESVIARSTKWVRAPRSGIVSKPAALGSRVVEGQSIATIGDPLGSDSRPVRSPLSGIVIGRSNLPMAHEGDALFNIGSFANLADTEDLVESFTEEQNAANTT